MKILPPPDRLKTWAIILASTWLALLLWSLYTEGVFL